MIWTIAIVSTGLSGTWLAARYWQGWILYTINEALWFAYAVHTDDTPLKILAVIWFIVGARNVLVTRKAALTKRQSPNTV